MTTAVFAPLVASTREAVKLSMQALWLTGRLLPVGGRLWVRHEFRSEESKPVEVVYSFALPRDAALRRFRVSGEDFSVHSELRPTAEAVKAYEEGIEAGSLATLARQYADGLVNLTVGNIRPNETVVVLLEVLAGVELHDGGFRFRFPFTLAPSYHAKARAMEVGPGFGEMELPRDEFGDLILPRFAKGAEGLHQVGFELSVEMDSEIAEIASPSHSIRVQKEDERRLRVLLSREADLPDRDLVLDADAKSDAPVLLAGASADGKGSFAAVIPSKAIGEAPLAARRVVILLDRSGSMSGVPIAQAKRAIDACLAALTPDDLFGLVAFDDRTKVFRPQLSKGTIEDRQRAREFLQTIDARGGTELAAGVTTAAKLLDGEPGDILVLTDGEVFGTEVILEQARATGARLHCLGIGSASQDRFLSLLSSQTGGVSRFLTPAERVDLVSVELFASIGRPVAWAVTVAVEGVEGAQVAPEPPPAVFAGTPLALFGESPAAGEGYLRINWEGHAQPAGLNLPLSIRHNELGDTLRLLRGARLITDFESRYVPESRGNAAAKREARRIAERLVRLGEEYGLANREMSLVAVVSRPSDRPGEVPKTQIVPVGMPQYTQFESVFGARPIVPMASAPRARLLSRVSASMRMCFADALPTPETPPMYEVEPEPPDEAGDLLIALAAMLESDGGMPGATEKQRIANTLAALLYFLQNGSTRKTGPFRGHVERLAAFLESQALDSLEAGQADAVRAALAEVASGRTPSGDWQPYAEALVKKGQVDARSFWKQLAAGFQSEE